ncbi:MAG: hypothetical protein AAF772_04200 [Acidobacteriota bacterium]
MNETETVNVQESNDDDWAIEVIDTEDLASDDEYAAVIWRSSSCCTSC